MPLVLSRMLLVPPVLCPISGVPSMTLIPFWQPEIALLMITASALTLIPAPALNPVIVLPSIVGVVPGVNWANWMPS